MYSVTGNPLFKKLCRLEELSTQRGAKRIFQKSLQLFRDIRSRLERHQLVREEKPVCYNYSIECQLFSPTIINPFHTYQSRISDGLHLHFWDFLQEEFRDYNIIFTDASKKYLDLAPAVVGGAMVAKTNSRSRQFILPSETLTSEAEAFAIWKALWYAWENNLKKVLILTDAKSVLKKLTCTSYKANSLPIILDIKLKTLLMAKKNSSKKFGWVPGHSGIEGNEEADRLSKEAWQTGENCLSYKTDYRNLLTWISQSFHENSHSILNRWVDQSGLGGFKDNTTLVKPIQNETDIIRGFKRDECVTYLRLLSGKCADLKYIERIGRRENSLCICGSADSNIPS